MFAFWVVWPPLHVSHCSSLSTAASAGEDAVVDVIGQATPAVLQQ